MANNLLSKTLPDLSKLEPLDGSNCKRWSQKLLIFFEKLELDYVLTTEAPKGDSSSTLTGEQKKDLEVKVAKFEKDNKLVRGHLLNHMNNLLFDLFVNYKSSKSIWETLEKKYGVNDAGRKKYIVGKWINFKLEDDKPIIEQVHVYENLVAEIIEEGTTPSK